MKRETTPFAILTIETSDERDIWAKFYWSKNSGMYGHQVITECAPNGEIFVINRTNGCGYCKKTAALEEFLMQATEKYIGLGGDLEYWLWGTPYHVGGNEFQIPLDKIPSVFRREERA